MQDNIIINGEAIKELKKFPATQKPLKLLERVIAISSKLNDLVLDRFSGTMTTNTNVRIFTNDTQNYSH